MIQREAPAEWQSMLGQWGENHERLGHLGIWWDPSVDRWVLVEHVPRDLIPSDVIETLQVNPLATPFRARQAQVFRETGKLPLAFFIIQGDKGGHKLAYSELEADLAQWYTGSREPPAPGSLPYAPFDQRVIDQLHRLEWLLGTYRGYEDAAGGDATEARRRMRQDILALIESSLEEVIDAAMPALLEADLPKVDRLPDYDELNARYVETGEMDAPAGMLSGGPSVTVPFPH